MELTKTFTYYHKPLHLPDSRHGISLSIQRLQERRIVEHLKAGEADGVYDFFDRVIKAQSSEEWDHALKSRSRDHWTHRCEFL